MATPISNKLYVTYTNGQPSLQVMPDISRDPNYNYLKTQFQEIKSMDQLVPAVQQAYQANVYQAYDAQQKLNQGIDYLGSVGGYYSRIPQQIRQQAVQTVGALGGLRPDQINASNIDQVAGAIGFSPQLIQQFKANPNSFNSDYVQLTPEEQKKYGFDSPFALASSFEQAKQQEADVASGKLVPIGTAANGQPLYAPAGSAATQPRLKTNQTAALGSTERTNQLLAEASQQTGIPAQVFPTGGQTIESPQTSPQTTTQGGSPQANAYGLTGEYAQMYTLLQGYLDKLTASGQSINPDVEITPDRVAEFMGQAQSNLDAFLPYASKEIKPYFENQLKVAREGFLRGLGYSQEQLLQQEADLERRFKESQRNIGESAAESGFAQSGMRVTQERDNIDATQRAINQGRSQAQQKATELATGFAQQFGTANLPGFNVQGTPKVGDTGFSRGGDNPYYQLSPETYEGLKGEQEFAQESATRKRAAELEEAFRGSLATNQQRRLTL